MVVPDSHAGAGALWSGQEREKHGVHANVEAASSGVAGRVFPAVVRAYNWYDYTNTGYDPDTTQHDNAIHGTPHDGVP